MRIRKTMTDKALQANKDNAQHSSGPKTERGKKVASENPGKHWIYSNHLKLDENDKRAFNILFKKLRRGLVDPDDAAGILAAEMLATEYFRYAKSRSLDVRLYTSHSPGNEALEAAGQAGLLHLAGLGSGSSADWQVEELNLTSTKGSESEDENGGLAIEKDRGHHLGIETKFVNPLPGILRAQSAAERRFFRALREYRKFQKGGKSTKSL